MSLAENGSLKDYLAKHRENPISTEDKIKIARDVANGMSYLSKKRVYFFQLTTILPLSVFMLTRISLWVSPFAAFEIPYNFLTLWFTQTFLSEICLLSRPKQTNILVFLGAVIFYVFPFRVALALRKANFVSRNIGPFAVLPALHSVLSLYRVFTY